MDPVRERENILATLNAAVCRISDLVSTSLIPPGGLLFCYAMKGARDNTGVAAVVGGILPRGDTGVSPATCRFGISDPATRAILTVMKIDPMMRSAAVLEYSDRTLAILENDLFLACASFAQVRGGDIITMDWGIALCCCDGVPDVVYEKRSDMAASRLILLGENPADVANNIIICSNRV